MKNHKIVLFCDFKELNANGKELDTILHTFTVHMPFIVNTKAVAANDEIILASKQNETKRIKNGGG